MANKARVIRAIMLPEEKQENKNSAFIQYDSNELLEICTREAINQVFKKKGGIGVPIQNLYHLIVSRYKIDMVELIDYTNITLEEMPDISTKSLSILLLLKVANNSKNKKMGRISKEMLKENWWAKSSGKQGEDFYKKVIEFFKKQKTKDLIKEILFTMLEIIIQLFRATDEKNQK